MYGGSPVPKKWKEAKRGIMFVGEWGGRHLVKRGTLCKEENPEKDFWSKDTRGDPTRQVDKFHGGSIPKSIIHVLPTEKIGGI